ncbi:hypothetical protein PAE3182 [Pyrobaculum aerophilum str. IM2]|uniref:Uncharacterized protein n=1 Tax=Pyrobaculum aerophilum (strain ATCC 51768 / DSM 7523 / JCM 9630 / CIP 104966 / NBRC 100827 / IM2) TaxID=178306 RepID=Q8ZTM7_PYRAE|nr:hypothetical protein [Pyrobaculum aerophilum]AAL64732.1 hypothetical protein PAE3182 [Pyrobaculum aerophilum str. IM2]
MRKLKTTARLVAFAALFVVMLSALLFMTAHQQPKLKEGEASEPPTVGGMATTAVSKEAAPTPPVAAEGSTATPLAEAHAGDGMASARRGSLRVYIEDDLGPINGSVFVLPAAPPNYTMPAVVKPVSVIKGSGTAPKYAVEVIRNWTAHKAHKIGVMLIVINGTDVAITTAAIDPREVARALESGQDYEIKAKVRGKVKRQSQERGQLSFAACPEAEMVKEDEFEGGWIMTPLIRVKNNADVYGTFSISLASVYEKRFSFGFAIQEDIKDLINVNFGIEAYAYSLGGQYAGSDSSTIPPKGGVWAISIYTWGRYEIYRIVYYASDPKGCLILDEDWLYRVYPNSVLTDGNTIVMSVADVTNMPEAVVPGTEAIVYAYYGGTGSSPPYYKIDTINLAGWFYQECPGSIPAPDVGAGMDLGKLIKDYASKVGRIIAERFTKVLEMVGTDVAWTGGTSVFVVLGNVRFDAPRGAQFSVYFYTTQTKVEIPSCGKVDLPFIYAEFR